MPRQSLINYELEIERINERLFRESKFQIQDRDSYDLAFEDLFSAVKLSSKQKELRNRGFKDYVERHPEVSEERLFTKAKGRDLRRDRLKTAKKVVKTRKEFIRATAPDVDLKGFDTARQKVSKDVIIRRTFTIPSLVKGRVVFSIKTSVVVRGNRVVRHRDSKGRFASVKIK